MDDENGDGRTMAVCVDCGSAYAARERSEGALLPIGNPNGCQCGGTEFVEMNSDATLDSSENGRAVEDD